MATSEDEVIPDQHDDVVAVLREVRSTLAAAYKFLESRDLMNAAVHCLEVRWSPLTTRVYRAMDDMAELIKRVPHD